MIVPGNFNMLDYTQAMVYGTRVWRGGYGS